MLHVELENGRRFVTAMRYEVLPEIVKDPLAVSAKVLNKKIHLWQKKHKEDKEASPYASKCSETMVGTAQNLEEASSIDKHPVTCFYAKK